MELILISGLLHDIVLMPIRTVSGRHFWLSPPSRGSRAPGGAVVGQPLMRWRGRRGTRATEVSPCVRDRERLPSGSTSGTLNFLGERRSAGTTSTVLLYLFLHGFLRDNFTLSLWRDNPPPLEVSPWRDDPPPVILLSRLFFGVDLHGFIYGLSRRG